MMEEKMDDRPQVDIPQINFEGRSGADRGVARHYAFWRNAKWRNLQAWIFNTQIAHKDPGLRTATTDGRSMGVPSLKPT